MPECFFCIVVTVTSRRAKRYTAPYTKAFASQMYKDLGVRIVVFSLQKDEDDDIKVGLCVQLGGKTSL